MHFFLPKSCQNFNEEPVLFCQGWGQALTCHSTNTPLPCIYGFILWAGLLATFEALSSSLALVQIFFFPFFPHQPFSPALSSPAARILCSVQHLWQPELGMFSWLTATKFATLSSKALAVSPLVISSHLWLTWEEQSSERSLLLWGAQRCLPSFPSPSPPSPKCCSVASIAWAASFP